MEVVQLLFTVPTATNAPLALEAVEGYVTALVQHGQLVAETTTARIRRAYVVTARMNEAEALAARFTSATARKRLRALVALGIGKPVVRRLGTDPNSRPPCACRRRPFLVLYTTFLNSEPPLRCGGCFGAVGLYRVPTDSTSGLHQHVLWWQDSYQAMDWLFIGSGAGERFAHDQLSRYDSALSADGRELARALEKRLGVPVYYYLAKHLGRSYAAERARKCPSCRKAWLLAQRLHRFDFQCERCRLLSNVAFDVRPMPRQQ
jgi:predicted  nucleic acid-binding Zn ribbon protein